MRSQSIFLADRDDKHAGISGKFSRLLDAKLGDALAGIEKMPGGINSASFKISAKSGAEYFGKIYREKKGDTRDRLGTEFSAATFLWRNGIRNIPEPVTADEEQGIALYGLIKGDKVKPGEISAADIDEAADFAEKLDSLKRADGADIQPMASEACFSIKEYMDCVGSRMSRLKASAMKGAAYNEVRTFLDGEFMHCLNAVVERAFKKAADSGISIDKILSKKHRTLSPSDFGFHNAIRSNGRLFFFDLEYYGWDDPAKMISDFFLQPAVPVPVIYSRRFLNKIRRSYTEGDSLEKRISVVYPVLGLKWCLIMLNVFLYNDGRNDDGAILSKRLKAAANKLKDVKRSINGSEVFLGA